MEKIYSGALALALCVILSACFSAWEGDTTLTINVGSVNATGARALEWPPTDANGFLSGLEHRITVTGPSGTLSRTLKKGETRAVFAIAAGSWDISVEAWYDDVLFGSGTANAEVKARQSNPVSIAMEQSDAIFYTVSGRDEWDLARAGIANGGNNKKYVIIITRDFEVPGIATSDYTFGPAKFINVTITGNHTLSLNNTGSLLRIDADQTVVIKDTSLKGITNNIDSLVYLGGGSFTMQGNASVHENVIAAPGTDGGGVIVGVNGIFTMQDNASVHGNEAPGYGGGVHISGITGGSNTGGIFIMKDNASVSSNFTTTAAGGGGGVMITDNGAFTMENGTVSDNTAAGNFGGGGVYVTGSGQFIMYNGTISGNKATHTGGVGGGGISARSGGTFVIKNGTVSGNKAATSGGGMFINYGFSNPIAKTCIMEGGTVSGNEADNGGGVYVTETGNTFTMTGGTISKNTATNGGGIYVLNSNFRIVNGTVYGNSANAGSDSNNASSGAALVHNGGYSQRGYFTGTTWTNRGSLTTTNNTIWVVNGELQP